MVSLMAISTLSTHLAKYGLARHPKIFNPLYVAMVVSGVALMGLLIWSIRDRRKETEETAR